MKNVSMYRLSKYWNRTAYIIIKIGRKMIWDYTGRNKSLLTPGEFARKYSEDLMCDRKVGKKRFKRTWKAIKRLFSDIHEIVTG